jgi:hypothetical protein
VKSFQAQTFYELLEVSVGAGESDIRFAFERLARLYAEDQVALYGLIDEGRARALRGRLQEAADTLLDAERRATYDAGLGLPPRDVPRRAAPPSAFEPRASAPVGWAGSYAFVSPTVVVSAPVATSLSYTIAAPVAAGPRASAPVAPRQAAAGGAAMVPPTLEAPALPSPMSPPGAETAAQAAAEQVAASAPQMTEAAVVAWPVETPPQAVAETVVASAPQKTDAPVLASPMSPPVVETATEVPTAAARVEGGGAAPNLTVTPTPTAPPVEPSAVLSEPVVAAPAAAALPSAAVTERSPEPAAPVPAVTLESEPPGASVRSPESVSPPSADQEEARPGTPGDDESGPSAIVPTRPFAPREYRPPERAKPYEVPAGVEFNGDLLRQVRMARGLSLLQVAERTRIGVRHLENLENDRYEQLPVAVYLRGMLMSLARELGLDGIRVSRSYLTFVEAHVSKSKG